MKLLSTVLIGANSVNLPLASRKGKDGGPAAKERREGTVVTELGRMNDSLEGYLKRKAGHHEEDERWMEGFGCRIRSLGALLASRKGVEGLSQKEVREYAKWRKRLQEFIRQAERFAARGVRSVRIARGKDGSPEAHVDQYDPVELTPLQVHLMEILSEDCGPRTDGLVGWKSVEHIQKALARRLGRPVSAQTISMNIRRLKDALETRIWIGEFLVQRRPKLGYRFLKRARTVPATRR